MAKTSEIEELEHFYFANIVKNVCKLLQEIVEKLEEKKEEEVDEEVGKEEVCPSPSDSATVTADIVMPAEYFEENEEGEEEDFNGNRLGSSENENQTNQVTQTDSSAD